MGFYDGATGLGTGTSTINTTVTTIENILASLGGTRFKTASQNLADRQKAIDSMLNLALSGNAAAVQQLIDWSGFKGEIGSIATDEAKAYDRRALVQYYTRSAVSVPTDLAAFLGIVPGVQPPAPRVGGVFNFTTGSFGSMLSPTTLALGAAAVIGFLAWRAPRRSSRSSRRGRRR